MANTVAPHRGKSLTFKLKYDSEKRFDELHAYRKENNLASNKADMMSQAVDLLYEKELGQWKPK